MNTKRKYEISIWEDYIVPTTYLGDGSIDVIEHYEERKIAIIGSDTMTAQCRAVEPKLVENINGTNTFTFKMYYVYTDNETGEKKNNPFLKLLVNERKVKTLWKGKWYDLIIKNIQEDSGGKSITYTCKDLYVNELSKTGFNLEFDNESENNMGTVEELAETVLEGTDWTLDKENSDEILQEKEEPVYEVKVTTAFSAIKEETEESIDIPVDATILIFYNQIQNIINSEAESGVEKLQFVYNTGYRTEKNSQLVINGDCCSANFNWTKENELATDTKYLNLTNCKIYYEAGVSDKYRAERLVSNYKTVYDPKIKRYVNVYSYVDETGEEKEIYGYEASDFKDPTIIGNIITNSKNFIDISGWTDPMGELVFGLYPELSIDSKNYLIFKESAAAEEDWHYYLNSGLQDTLFLPEGIQKGQKFIFRYKTLVQRGTGEIEEGYYTEGVFSIHIGQYSEDSNGLITPTGNSYFTINKKNDDTEWTEYELTCNTSVDKKSLQAEKIGIILRATAYPEGTYEARFWVEEFQFFEEVYGENADGEVVRINPGELSLLSTSNSAFKYYDPSSNYNSEDDLQYLYYGAEDWDEPTLERISNGFTKVRSITVKNSNRFNILQSLAETFECWIQFEIKHDEETGKVLYTNGIPQKFVKIKKEIGKETGIGFIYGIDLKTISRTIVSDQITTKVIVPANNNEFAKDGFCSIARSKENYPKTSFILDFGYYINQGLLNSGQLNKDLYLSTPDAIGYYYWLNQYNTQYDEITEKLTVRKKELDNFNSSFEVYSTTIKQAAEQLTSLNSDFYVLTGKKFNDLTAEQLEATTEDFPEAAALAQQIVSIRNTKDAFSTEAEKLEDTINLVQTLIDEYSEQQEEIRTDILHLDRIFYNKYSRFLQEGSWNSDEYVDDDLYYLDAQSIAYTSSRPQISYNISVMRLNALEEYQNKVFNIGDISFIQDTEFFGYEWIDQIKTPYKEKVLISEIVSNFDSPEQDSFKIQNYKTQFEDLFQRITATTQSLQYASGGYQKAANAFTENGEIKFETLQNSILVNQQLVFGAKNESVLQDSTGLTVTDIKNPNNKTKITSGGIFITTDGGVTWKGAIRGDGLSTQYLTTGAINVNNIIVYDGNFSSFRWDARGINAFDVLYHNEEVIGINTSKFVRFDHFGIYGIGGNSNYEGGAFAPINEEQVWDNASFALTWKGFMLKNRYGQGYVSIDSVEDFVVSDGNINRVKIGNIGSVDAPIYGMQLKDATGAITMETADNGTLWLKNRLNVETYLLNSSVGIGKLDTNETKDATHGGRIINANEVFVVYEDGHVKANSVRIEGNSYFKGEIIATGGKIGNMEIASLENLVAATSNFSVVIISDTGTTFKGWGGTKTLTAKIYENNVETNPTNVSYQWSKDGQLINGATEKTLTVTNTEGDELDVYTCEITMITEE